jgi:hypothetical protein
MTSIESIRKGSLFITITKQPGLPTYKTILEIHHKLKANAASVKWTPPFFLYLLF